MWVDWALFQSFRWAIIVVCLILAFLLPIACLLLGKAVASHYDVPMFWYSSYYSNTPLRKFAAIFWRVIWWGLAIWVSSLWVFSVGTRVFFPGVRSNWNETFEQSQALKTKQREAQQAYPMNEKLELRRYRLVEFDPPKHVYVGLKDVQTGQVYERLYVSKHCNNYQSNKLHDEYNIQVKTYVMSDTPSVPRIQFHDLYDVFCK